MGLFDEIRCKVELADELKARFGKGMADHWFQTKSLDRHQDYYEIREDGTLWNQTYEWSQDWNQLASYTGEIVFYCFASLLENPDSIAPPSGWVTFSAMFIRGSLRHLELLRYDTPYASGSPTAPCPPPSTSP